MRRFSRDTPFYTLVRKDYRNRCKSIRTNNRAVQRANELTLTHGLSNSSVYECSLSSILMDTVVDKDCAQCN